MTSSVRQLVARGSGETARHPRTPTPTPVVTLTFLLLVAASATALTTPSRQPTVLLCSGITAALCLVLIATQSSGRLASPLTLCCIVIGLSYVLRPVVLAERTATESLATLFDRNDLSEPAMIATGFCVAFTLGVLYPRVANSRTSDNLPVQALTHTVRVNPIAGVVAASMALLFLLYTFRITGFTLAGAFSDPALFRAAANKGGLFYLSGVTVALSWVPYWGLLVTNARARHLVTPMLVVSLLFGMVVTFPFGQRTYFMAPILGLIAVYELTRRTIKAKAILPLALGGIAAFGAYTTFRANQGASVSAANVYSLNSATEDFSGRFDAFDFWAQTYQTFGGEWLFGRSLYDLALQPIPRIWFPLKPSQTSAYLVSSQQPDVGRSFTPEYGLVTELYINGALFAVLVGAVLVGWAFVRFDSALTPIIVATPTKAFLMLPFISFPAQWLLGGINSFTTVSFVLFFLVLLPFSRWSFRS